MLCDASTIRRQKRFGRCTGVIAGAIVDQKQVLRGLCHDPLPERLVTVRVKPALDTLKEQTPGEIFNRPKHLVAFALATGRDCGLAARTIVGHWSCSHARRLTASR